MEPAEVLRHCLLHAEEFLDAATADLTQGEAVWQAGPKANSIGFILWHLSRVEDHFLGSFIPGSRQVWEAGGWAPRLGLPTDPEATGFGFNPEQVANFPVPPVALLLEYQRAVRQTTMKFVAGLGSADLECIVKRPRLADQTLLARLARIVVEVSQHSGQIDYIRGLKRNLGA